MEEDVMRGGDRGMRRNRFGRESGHAGSGSMRQKRDRDDQEEGREAYLRIEEGTHDGQEED